MISDAELRVDFWVYQHWVEASTIDALRLMANSGEVLDSVDGELLVFDADGGSQLATDRFPDMADLLTKKSTSEVLALHLRGEQPPQRQAPNPRQTEQAFKAEDAVQAALRLAKIRGAK